MGRGHYTHNSLSKSLANCSGRNHEAHEDVLWVITRTAGNSITKSAPRKEVVSHRTYEREILKYTHNVFPTSLKAHARLHQVRRKKGRKKEFKCEIFTTQQTSRDFGLSSKTTLNLSCISLYVHTHTHNDDSVVHNVMLVTSTVVKSALGDTDDRENRQ